MTRARSRFLKAGKSRPQELQQLFARPRDVPRAEREHDVSPLGDLAQDLRYVVLLGDVVHVGVSARLADGVHYQLAVHPGLGHLARAVDFGYEYRVRGGEGAAELAVELAGARVAVRLEDRDDPAARRCRRPGGLERCGELRGVVGVVVEYPDLRPLSLELEAAPHTAEV